jgi:hypothetical protein
MKEMDPSEELLMERAMMEDEDLLIEVESMRQTLQKLDKLPEIEPPSDVTESVLEKAAEQAEENRKNNSAFRKPAFKFAVAATLALTITAGGAWLYVGIDGNNGQQQQSVTSSPPSSTSAQVSESSAGVQLSNNSGNIQPPSTAAQEDGNIDPWVDRNDILRFEDHFSSQNEQFKAILDRSTRKLQLIENSIPNRQTPNSVQLTGTGN